MPFFPSLDDVLQVRVVSHYDNQNGINIRHCKVTQIDGAGVQMDEIARELDQDIGPLIKPLLGSFATYRGTEVKNLTGAKNVPIHSDLAAGPGTGGAQPMSKQTSGIATIRSDQAGRQFRGRIFVPFPAEEESESPGKPTAGYVTALGTYAGYFTGTLIIGGAPDTITIQWGIWSRQTQTLTPATGLVARDKWATQRRRSDYGARNDPPF